MGGGDNQPSRSGEVVPACRERQALQRLPIGGIGRRRLHRPTLGNPLRRRAFRRSGTDSRRLIGLDTVAGWLVATQRNTSATASFGLRDPPLERGALIADMPPMVNWNSQSSLTIPLVPISSNQASAPPADRRPCHHGPSAHGALSDRRWFCSIPPGASPPPTFLLHPNHLLGDEAMGQPHHAYLRSGERQGIDTTHLTPPIG